MSQRADSDLMRVFESFATFGDRCVFRYVVPRCRAIQFRCYCALILLMPPISSLQLPFPALPTAARWIILASRSSPVTRTVRSTKRLMSRPAAFAFKRLTRQLFRPSFFSSAVLDNNLTPIEVDIIFSRVKQRKERRLRFPEFRLAIAEMARVKVRIFILPVASRGATKCIYIPANFTPATNHQ